VKGKRRLRYEPIPQAVQAASYPVSSGQKRMYALQQLNSGTAYNIPAAYILEGPLTVTQVEAAMRQVVARHEALRTHFELVDGEVRQVVTDAEDFKVEYESQSAEAEEVMKGFVKPFDLGTAPLLRMKLVRRGETEHLVCVDMHHIISDLISGEVLIRDFGRAFGGERLEKVPVQYKDYAAWQQERLSGEFGRKQERYWLERFSGEIPVLNLPTDYVRPPVQSFAGGQVTHQLDAKLSAQLRELCQAQGVTLYMTMLAAYKVLLSKYSGQEDVVVGSPVMGRDHPDLTEVMGVFVNTLALRSAPERHKRFADYLKEIKQLVLEALEHQFYPFEELVERVEIIRDLSRNPLFTTMFDLTQAGERRRDYLRGARMQLMEYESRTAKFDLTINVKEGRENIWVSVEYQKDLYLAETILDFADRYDVILGQVASNPTILIADIETLAEKEKASLTAHSIRQNEEEASSGSSQHIHRQFEHWAVLTPTAIAVICGDYKITYQELNAKANALAQILYKNHVKPGEVIGLIVDRSVDMVVAVIGILKAGAAFLPIDPSYPAERINDMLDMSECRLIVTSDDSIKYNRTEIHLEEITRLSGCEINFARNEHRLQLAYAIYTSGSTGQPKAVAVEHGALSQVATEWQIQYGRKVLGGSVLQLASISTDVCIGDIVRALTNGGSLVICDLQSRLNPKEICRLLVEHQINFVESTPSLLIPVLRYAKSENITFPHLKVLVFGSDFVPRAEFSRLVDEFGEGTTIINSYGVTEATIDSSYFIGMTGNLPNGVTIPIGIPMGNTCFYVLDPNYHLVPPGAFGELFIAGSSLARGYVSRPDLTSERFIANPFRPGERMYRTGDFARRRADGIFELGGRIDQQIKINGIRIEPAEIETILQSYPGVERAVVVAQPQQGVLILCGYLVGVSELDLDEIRLFLRRRLPRTLIPSFLKILPAFPQSTAGKIDRRRLPLPSAELLTNGVSDQKNAAEEALADLFREEFGLWHVDRESHFFNLGGDSIRAMQFAGRISLRWRIEIGARDIFEKPAMGELADLLNSKQRNSYRPIPRAEVKPRYPVSYAQQRMYALHERDGGIAYNCPSAYVVSGKFDQTRIHSAFQRTVDRHEALRTRFLLSGSELEQHIDDCGDFVVQKFKEDDAEVATLLPQFVKPFHLGRDCLVRVMLISRPKDFLVLIDTHHIITDFISDRIVFGDFARFYVGASLNSPAFQYKDYAAWQRADVTNWHRDRDLVYWMEQLFERGPALEIPSDRMRSARLDSAGSQFRSQLPDDLSIIAHKCCSQFGLTPFMLLFSAYTIFLAKYCGSEDVIVGTSTSGRHLPELEKSVGLYLNALPLRCRPSGRKLILDYWSEIKRTVVQALDHQAYPFDHLLSELKQPYDHSRNPLFDSMFLLQYVDQQSISIPGLSVSAVSLPVTAVRFDLTMRVELSGKKIMIAIDYRRSLFREETIERMARMFRWILQQMLMNHGLRIDDVDLVDSEERVKLKNFSR